MGKKLEERIKYWLQLLLLPVYGLSFLIPRNKKIWLFGSTFGRRFADNPRYFYLYLTEHPEEEIRPIWISHNKGVVSFLKSKAKEAYYYKSLKGIWYSLIGSIYIFDNYSKDINFWTSGGAIKFNLWHGTGNKRANHDNVFDKVRHPKTKWEKFVTFPRRLSDEKPTHYTLATSEPLAVITKSAFASKDMEHVVIDGYPRNDAMLDSNFPNIYSIDEVKNIEQIKKWKADGKIIDFYMPTFRDSEKLFFDVMDLEKFNEFLAEHNIVFLIKLHPKSKLKREFDTINYSNLHSIDAEVDPYSFMNLVDILTSDYSSVYSDFMLLNRPVVAFHYDYKEYAMNTRDCYVPFEEYMPELKAIDMDTLMEDTLIALKNDPCKEKRLESRNRMFLYQDANSTVRLIRKVKQMLR